MLGMCGSSIKGVVKDQSWSTPGSTGAVCPSSFLPFATFTIIVFYHSDKRYILFLCYSVSIGHNRKSIHNSGAVAVVNQLIHNSDIIRIIQIRGKYSDIIRRFAEHIRFLFRGGGVS